MDEQSWWPLYSVEPRTKIGKKKKLGAYDNKGSGKKKNPEGWSEIYYIHFTSLISLPEEVIKKTGVIS